MASVIVVDASVLYEVLIDTDRAERLRDRLAHDPDHAAPQVIDAEVLGLIRRDWLRGVFSETAASLAASDLAAWPADRFGHRGLLARAWDLRHELRSWDALYVALAEALDAPLLTLDGRLAATRAPRCAIELVDR